MGGFNQNEGGVRPTSKNGRGEQFLILTLRSEESEEIRSIKSYAPCARPLREQLRAETDVDTVEVVGHEEHLLQIAKRPLTHGSFLFFGQLVLNTRNFRADELVVLGKLSNASQILDCFLDFATLDKIAWRFVVEEGER